jgi:hypothetical protein
VPRGESGEEGRPEGMGEEFRAHPGQGRQASSSAVFSSGGLLSANCWRMITGGRGSEDEISKGKWNDWAGNSALACV